MRHKKGRPAAALVPVDVTPLVTAFRDELHRGDRRHLLSQSAWLLRFVTQGNSYVIPAEVVALAAAVARELIHADMAFALGDALHLEDCLGLSRPKYWRRSSVRRNLSLQYSVWRDIRTEREGGLSALEAFACVAERHAISDSKAQKLYYAEEKALRALPAMQRRMRAELGPRIVATPRGPATIQPVRAADFSQERRKIPVKTRRK
jgi:hypothetical protein